MESLKEKFKEIIECPNPKDAKATPESKYITAWDPKVQRRVVFIVQNGKAISLITGYTFKYEEDNANKKNP
jgi:hypothetical protein